MQNLTTTHRPATCPLDTSPAWCTADHYGDDNEHHAHSTLSTSPVIETLHPRNGQPTNWCVDIEQADGDSQPVIVMYGTALDETLTLDDAERIACQILAQVILARNARQAVAA